MLIVSTSDIFPTRRHEREINFVNDKLCHLRFDQTVAVSLGGAENIIFNLRITTKLTLVDRKKSMQCVFFLHVLQFYLL